MRPAAALTFLLLVKYALMFEATASKKNYIVYRGGVATNTESTIKANHEILASITGSLAEAQDSVVHHYSKSFCGFSAMLTPEQAQQLRKRDRVISVFESKMKHIQTTHSWEFLRADSIFKHNPLLMHSASDVIIGILDTGIWPESLSFSDDDLGPVPQRFRGRCVRGVQFNSSNCNRKLIGARFYYKGFEALYGPLKSFNQTFFLSPRDSHGHGTHTASTIAGSAVTNVSLYGMARGTAEGGAPKARLSIYKVCWFYGACTESDILAAMDDAISDGVDIISISLGSIPTPYLSDPVSLGALHAVQNGILVSASAGNSFFPGTVANLAPWILTVATSSIDREFQTNIELGNSEVIKGSSLNRIEMTGALITGRDAPAPGVSQKNASSCMNGTLDPVKIEGKIVICQRLQTEEDDGTEKHITVQQGGGHGIIMISSLLTEVGFLSQYPIAVIGPREAEKLLSYIAIEKNPTAQIFKTKTRLKTKPAPRVAMFNSRGPNALNPEIIKPDIAAPGVNILAAWSPVDTTDTAGESINFNILTGTSMACPHITAIVAILKSWQPDWSPAALKSAIMTTATTLDNTQSPIQTNPNGTNATPFDFGSGQVDVVAAMDPGLVYDFDMHDILHFLCASNASKGHPTAFLTTGEPFQCVYSRLSYDFNYPSIGAHDINGSVTVTRTVTYYGNIKTVYVAFVESPAGVNVRVIPGSLYFEKSGEKKSFLVHFTPVKTTKGEFVFGALIWSNGTNKVRSPIALSVNSLKKV